MTRSASRARTVVGAIAALAVFILLLAGIIGMSDTASGLRNWLVVLLAVDAGAGNVTFDALRVFNPLDVAILVLTSVAFAGFWPGPTVSRRAWMAVAMLLPLVGVGVLLATGLWGRSGLMSAAIVMACLLLGSRRVLSIVGILANSLLLVGDFGTTGSRSLPMAVIVGAGYGLLLVWYAGVALALRSRTAEAG